MMLKFTMLLLGAAFAIWFGNEVYKYLLARKYKGTKANENPKHYPQTFKIESEVLPDFPSYKPILQDIWKILNQSKKLQKLLPKGVEPSSMIGELYTVSYNLDLKKDSEMYPRRSPITLVITMKEDK